MLQTSDYNFSKWVFVDRKHVLLLFIEFALKLLIAIAYIYVQQAKNEENQKRAAFNFPR